MISRCIWHRAKGAPVNGCILGFSQATINNLDSVGQAGGIGVVRPVAVVQVDGETRLRYIELKYLEMTK